MQTENFLRQAILTLPTVPEAHAYLAQLLALPGTERERGAAINAQQYDLPLLAVIQSSFWVDPVKGGLTRRVSGLPPSGQ